MNTFVTLIALTASLPFIFDYFTRSTPAPTLSFAGPMLSAMCDTAPTASGVPSTPVDVDQDDDEGSNDFHPFDARELPDVCERVVMPITVEALDGDGYVQYVAHSVERNHYNDSVQLFDANDDHVVVLSGYAQVELVGAVTVLDAPDGVKAYVGDGELLCAEHGAPFDIGLSDGAVSPVFDASHLDSVEYCSHHFGPGNYGHSFCGACGTHTEPKGHPDSGFNGPLFVCDNCSTQAVYVDGEGYDYVDGFDDLTDTYNVKVTLDAAQRVHPFGWSSRLQPIPSGVVTAVRDNAAHRRWTSNWGFVCYLDDDPSAGVLLNISDTGMAAWDEALDYFDEALTEALAEATDEDDAEGIRSDFHASLQCIRVRLDEAVSITRK